MELTFYKYQGTGNDFIMIDNRDLTFPKADTKLVAHLCDRKFGVGADGLILLEEHPEFDFEMVYYNSDGNQSSMCGNGGRCSVAFAKKLNWIKNKATFFAIDGLHHATVSNEGIVSLQMGDVLSINKMDNAVFLDTGSPHHVELRENLKNLNVKEAGAVIRYSDTYSAKGTNVNFVEQISDSNFAVRTYERGVEDETLSCGTGVTAVALAMFATQKTESKSVDLKVMGGTLNVSFEPFSTGFKNIFLTGPAQFVFKGIFKLD